MGGVQVRVAEYSNVKSQLSTILRKQSGRFVVLCCCCRVAIQY